MRDEHFLIVRLGAVCGGVMASALGRRIRDEHPGARITWLSGLTAAPLVRQFAEVDAVIAVGERRLLRGGPLARIAALLPLWRRLLAALFSHVVLGHVVRRYRLLIAPIVGA